MSETITTSEDQYDALLCDDHYCNILVKSRLLPILHKPMTEDPINYRVLIYNNLLPLMPPESSFANVRKQNCVSVCENSESIQLPNEMAMFHRMNSFEEDLRSGLVHNGKLYNYDSSSIVSYSEDCTVHRGYNANDIFAHGAICRFVKWKNYVIVVSQNGALTLANIEDLSIVKRIGLLWTKALPKPVVIRSIQNFVETEDGFYFVANMNFDEGSSPNLYSFWIISITTSDVNKPFDTLCFSYRTAGGLCYNFPSQMTDQLCVFDNKVLVITGGYINVYCKSLQKSIGKCFIKSESPFIPSTSCEKILAIGDILILVFRYTNFWTYTHMYMFDKNFTFIGRIMFRHINWYHLQVTGENSVIFKMQIIKTEIICANLFEIIDFKHCGNFKTLDHINYKRFISRDTCRYHFSNIHLEGDLLFTSNEYMNIYNIKDRIILKSKDYTWATEEQKKAIKELTMLNYFMKIPFSVPTDLILFICSFILPSVEVRKNCEMDIRWDINNGNHDIKKTKIEEFKDNPYFA